MLFVILWYVTEYVVEYSGHLWKPALPVNQLQKMKVRLIVYTANEQSNKCTDLLNYFTLTIKSNLIAGFQSPFFKRNTTKIKRKLSQFQQNLYSDYH